MSPHTSAKALGSLQAGHWFFHSLGEESLQTFSYQSIFFNGTQTSKSLQKTEKDCPKVKMWPQVNRWHYSTLLVSLNRNLRPSESDGKNDTGVCKPATIALVSMWAATHTSLSPHICCCRTGPRNVNLGLFSFVIKTWELCQLHGGGPTGEQISFLLSELWAHHGSMEVPS